MPTPKPIRDWFAGEPTTMKFVIIAGSAIGLTALIGGWFVSDIRSDIRDVRAESNRMPDRITDAFKTALTSSDVIKVQVNTNNSELRLAIDGLRQSMEMALTATNKALAEIQVNTAVQGNELKNVSQRISDIQLSMKVGADPYVVTYTAIERLLEGTKIDASKVSVRPYDKKLVLIPWPDYADIATTEFRAQGWKGVTFGPAVTGWEKP